MTILRDPAGERLFLQGRLEGLCVPDLIYAVCLPRKTGTLTFAHGEISKTVYIQDGRLIFATSTLPEERLGETLLRAGSVGYEQLEQGLARLGGGKRLGSILVELGYLEPANLVRGLLHQVKEIILSLFPWESGSYRFAEGPLPTAEVITLNISNSRLICEGIRRITAWPRIVRSVGGSRTTYRLTRDGQLLAEELDLGPAERLMLGVLDEPATVGHVCTSVFLPNFEVYQYLWAFRILGIVHQVEPEGRGDAPDPLHPCEWQGNMEETPIAALLLRFFRGKETGILFLSREGEEKSIHIRAGELVFATSNRMEEALTTFLLRRGVIGLRDKEEIERHTLSNKRPGTILQELGILSQDELVRYVREQLLEIVHSVFSWSNGVWRFVSGEPPTCEEITLDRPIGELILQGIRRVQGWSRIRSGCGDLGTLLRPADDIRSALAGIELAPDEKEVLAALRTPRTVAQVCQTTPLSDHRVAQILWALEILGAVIRDTEETIGAEGERVASRAESIEADAGEPNEEARAAIGTDAGEPAGEEPAAIEADAGEPAEEEPAAIEADAGEPAEEKRVATAPAGVHGIESDVDGREVCEESRIESKAGGADPGHTDRNDGPSVDHAVPPLQGIRPEPEGAPALGADSTDENASDRRGRERMEGERPGEASRRSDPDEAARPTPGGTGAFPPGHAPRNALEAVGTGVLEEIDRFNRRHREVYAVLKGAVGAGGRNFVSTCVRRLSETGPLFADLPMDETGAFSSSSLFERIGSLSPAIIRARLESLITEEVDFAQMFLDGQTVRKMALRIESVTGELVGHPSR